MSPAITTTDEVDDRLAPAAFRFLLSGLEFSASAWVVDPGWFLDPAGAMKATWVRDQQVYADRLILCSAAWRARRRSVPGADTLFHLWVPPAQGARRWNLDLLRARRRCGYPVRVLDPARADRLPFGANPGAVILDEAVYLTDQATAQDRGAQRITDPCTVSATTTAVTSAWEDAVDLDRWAPAR